MGLVKIIVNTESWVTDNAFCCRVRKYQLKRFLFIFNRWELVEDDCYASFDYFIKNKINIYQDFIMDVSKEI